MNIFVTSDRHWGHRMLARMRGFDSPEAMNEALVEAWNKVVGPRDEVWDLGDVSFMNATKTVELFKRLNGRKRYNIVPGNHDGHQALTALANAGATIHPPIVRRKFCGEVYKTVLCHYPLLTWPHAAGYCGAVHLHGHCHGNLEENTTRTDVGADALWCRMFPGQPAHAPVEIETVIKLVQNRDYIVVDHHGRGV